MHQLKKGLTADLERSRKIGATEVRLHSNGCMNCAEWDGRIFAIDLAPVPPDTGCLADRFYEQPCFVMYDYVEETLQGVEKSVEFPASC